MEGIKTLGNSSIVPIRREHERASEANRQTPRVCVLNISSETELTDQEIRDLFRVCSGATMVLRYCGEEEQEGRFAFAAADLIFRLCEQMQASRNEVLCILCLPCGCEQIKRLFWENLDDISFVELGKEIVTGEQAHEYLCRLARQHHIRTTASLFTGIGDPERSFSAAELGKQFNHWLGERLKNNIYPQYRSIQGISKARLQRAPMGSAYQELQQMIGLDQVKTVIGEILDFYKAQKLFNRQGMKISHPAVHLVFTGNPGTAKTTVARLVARILMENGILSRGDLFEVGRSDLVGKYVGWTAQIVKQKFKAARGSVLFIDEAYSLLDDSSSSFGDEAINTIVQEMENNREDIVVIFAGYPEPMQRFLSRNPGLRSRIAFHVSFEDYTPEELCRITALLARQRGRILAPEADEELMPLFTAARKNTDFGNGRYARNLLEKAEIHQASRLVKLPFDAVTETDIKTLQPEDFRGICELPREKKIPIGFAGCGGNRNG